MDFDIHRVNSWLKENRRSQAWLAEQVGVATGTVNRWLNGKLKPTAAKILLVDRLIGATSNENLPDLTQKVNLKFPVEVWELVEKLAAVQGLSPEQFVQKYATRIAEEIAWLLLQAQKQFDK